MKKVKVTYENDDKYGTILKIVNGVPISFVKVVERTR